MTFKETIPMMMSDNYSDRLKAEYFQLKIRAEEIKDALDRYPPPLINLELLAAQYKAMQMYQKILEARLVDEDIDITEERNMKLEEIRTLEDTLPLMLSNAPKTRILAEYFQLKFRIEKLSRFMKRAKEGKVKLPYPWTMLDGQLKYMRSYRNVLKARIDIEGISLEE